MVSPIGAKTALAAPLNGDSPFAMTHVVPEPGASVLLAGLGLVLFASQRRSRG